MAFAEDLWAYVTTRPTLSGLLGKRFYPHVAPDETIRGEASYAVYEQVSGVRWRTGEGATGKKQARYQIECWGRTATAARRLADALYVALDSFKGTMGASTVDCVMAIDEQDDLEMAADQDKRRWYGVRFDFMFWHGEARPANAR